MITLVHEIAEIFYDRTTPGTPPDTQIELEAQRFYRENPNFVKEVYKSIISL